MTRHVILWKLKDDIADRGRVMAEAKRSLEALTGKIEGLISMSIITNPRDTSNADMMLDASFTDGAALAFYASHPEHRAAADTYVRPYIASRTCIDYDC